MSADFFRIEAVEAQKSRTKGFGKPRLSYPSIWKWLTAGSVFFIAFITVLMSFVEFSRTETVSGQLGFTNAETQIYAENAGVIDTVYVTEGSFVDIGDTLLEIRTDQQTRSGSRFSDDQEKYVRKEIASQIARIKIAKEQSALALEEMQAEKNASTVRIEQNRAKLELVTTQEKYAMEQYKRAKALFDSGLVVEDRVSQAKDALDRLRLQQLDLLSLVSEAEITIQKEDIKARNIQALLDKELNQINQTLAQLQQKLTRSSANGTLYIQSTIRGYVDSLQVKKGELVRANRFLMAVVPENAELIAELFLPSKAIAFVKEGQDVKFKFDAFPHRKYGMLKGKLASFASTALLSSDLEVISDKPTLLYKAQAELNLEELPQLFNNVSFQSGMKVEAQIILEKRNIFDWLWSSLVPTN